MTRLSNNFRVKYMPNVKFKAGKNTHSIFVLGSICMALLSGCATSNQMTAGAFESSKSKAAAAQAAGDLVFVDDFQDVSLEEVATRANLDTFKIGDTAEIAVYNVSNLSGEYVVDRKGNIIFPLIGAVKVAGLSTLDVQEKLTQRYGEKYLQSPSISVNLKAQQLGKIVVDGSVAKPGVFKLNNLIRLSEAVALAGGLSEDANRREVYIVRTENGVRKIKSVDLDAVRKFGAADPQLIPSDIVYVQDSTARIAFKEVLRALPLVNLGLVLATR